jgi:hypothetical protein
MPASLPGSREPLLGLGSMPARRGSRTLECLRLSSLMTVPHADDPASRPA